MRATSTCWSVGSSDGTPPPVPRLPIFVGPPASGVVGDWPLRTTGSAGDRRGQGLGQFLLASPQLGQFVGPVPWLADSGLGLGSFRSSSSGLGRDRRERLGQALKLAFEAVHDHCGVGQLPVASGVGDLHVGGRDREANLVLDCRECLGADAKAPKGPDLDHWSVGLRRRCREPVIEEPLETLTGVGPLREPLIVDGHGEPVAVGVDQVLDGPSQRGGSLLRTVSSLTGGVEGSAEAVLVVLVGAFETGELGHVGVHAGLLQHEGVARGQDLDLGEGERLVADVVDVTIREVASGYLGDEGGLSFKGLPHVGVEAASGDVADDLDLRILVALAQDTAVSLFDVGRALWRVEMVHGHGSGLDVGADAHGLGGSDNMTRTRVDGYSVRVVLSRSWATSE